MYRVNEHSKRFFERLEEVSKITGLDGKLLERFKVIWSTLATVNAVNPDKYDLYVKDLKKLHLKYRIPPSIHKMRIYAEVSIRLAPFPIWMLSEEARKSKNIYDSDDTIHEKPWNSTLLWTSCTHYSYLPTL